MKDKKTLYAIITLEQPTDTDAAVKHRAIEIMQNYKPDRFVLSSKNVFGMSTRPRKRLARILHENPVNISDTILMIIYRENPTSPYNGPFPHSEIWVPILTEMRGYKWNMQRIQFLIGTGFISAVESAYLEVHYNDMMKNIFKTHYNRMMRGIKRSVKL